MIDVNDQHREILASFSQGIQSSLKTGAIPAEMLRKIGAFNHDRAIRGSYPFQVISDDEGMMGLLSCDQVALLIDLARQFSLEDYFKRVDEDGVVALFFGYPAMPLATRLFPQEFSFVHSGENSIVLDDFQAISIGTLDKAARINFSLELLALFDSAI